MGMTVMLFLICGLVLFLGCHSLRVGPASLRDGLVQRLGAGGFKGLYSIFSLIGFALIIWGYGQARLSPSVVWLPPLATRHIAILLMLPALILMVGAYIPANVLKAKLHHPMILSVKVWALAHLLSNGNLADILLFGSFLIWAVLAFRAARQRDRANPAEARASKPLGLILTLVLGTGAWAALIMGGHRLLIGVSPFGR
jgi:uncharacterized membrane protein